MPGGIFPASYNSGYQIIQAPGYVVIVYEMIHEARIIPLDNSKHLPPAFRLWNGDSRGHWEGNTLVVDITNYNDKGNVATNIATQRIRALPQSEALHVVERFTRVDETTINYEVTVDDPKVFSTPWKVAMPLTLEPKHQPLNTPATRATTRCRTPSAQAVPATRPPGSKPRTASNRRSSARPAGPLADFGPPHVFSPGPPVIVEAAEGSRPRQVASIRR